MMLIHLLAPKYSLLKINTLSRVQVYTPDCWRLRSAMRSLTPPTTMTEFRHHKRNFCGWELPYRPFWSLITQFSYLSTSSLPRSLLLLACLCRSPPLRPWPLAQSNLLPGVCPASAWRCKQGINTQHLGKGCSPWNSRAKYKNLSTTCCSVRRLSYGSNKALGARWFSRRPE